VSGKLVDLRARDETLPVVLECGAGNGVLAFHLSQRLKGVATVVATDDFSSKIAAVTEVHHLSCKQALERYQPAMVICSWMPSGTDFTGDMRACPSVHDIVLLGPVNPPSSLLGLETLLELYSLER
jgi:hypothetical protein